MDSLHVPLKITLPAVTVTAAILWTVKHWCSNFFLCLINTSIIMDLAVKSELRSLTYMNLLFLVKYAWTKYWLNRSSAAAEALILRLEIWVITVEFDRSHHRAVGSRFLLGAGWKSHYVTLTSYCHKWHRINGRRTRPSLGQEDKTKVFVTLRRKKKKEWKYPFPVPSPNPNPNCNTKP